MVQASSVRHVLVFTYMKNVLNCHMRYNTLFILTILLTSILQLVGVTS
ncbi:hypothetical protein Golax_015339 [Gossypium laxum]|uniref:Uncharacterized protein n=1 Tax=Gossypium laxum TaxID=34288 RepID=A0A7J8ZXI9_9ROSI|nr:hypothetical protein [Gossypium laxum]